MKKKDILKNFTITKVDDNTVFIRSRDFDFAFTKADSVVKEEYKGKYKYFGGLQCAYRSESENYKNLEKWLVEIADIVLGF